ncbi:unnamed protein product [Clonostachys byssicola]|uniref:JmjC domain-containing protein n=1 Tax=Clonostachys byssicola TaxID=160290 RepID=A0A9N9UEU7_9HYPO|nr:unnamed protein product [Clonostachys byssicola]
MGDMPTKDVIYAQRPEGMKTKVSDAEFIPTRIVEAPLLGTMPRSIQTPRNESPPTNAPRECIDLTLDDSDSDSHPAPPFFTTRYTHKEPRGIPAEKTSKGTPIDQGTAHHKRKNEDDPRDSGAQKQRKSAEPQSLGNTPQAHATQQARPRFGDLQTGVVDLSIHSDKLKDFPCVLSWAIKKNARAQGVFKLTLLNGRTLGRRAIAWRPKSYLEYSCKALGKGLSRVELKYTRNASLIGGRNVHSEHLPSVAELIKKQEERLESNSLSGLRYRAGIPIRSEVEREGMGLPTTSPIHPLDGNRLAQTRRCIDGIHTPRCYETDILEGTPFVMSLEECNLYSLHLLYEGRRVWICVSPDAKEKFEERIRKEIAEMRGEDAKTSHCGQFVRHERLYFSRSLLEEWGIAYTIVDQKAGEVVVTLPGTYHQGFTVGHTKTESVNYADEEWEPSKLLWCDDSCAEYSIDIQDMDIDVVGARVPEASIDRRGGVHCADPHQPRNKNRQQPAIETNLGRSLTPYGQKLVWAFTGNELELGTDNHLDLDSITKARVLQLIMQCEWPGHGDDITTISCAAGVAELFASVACIKKVRRMADGLELVVNSCLRLGNAHQRALEKLAKTHRRPTDYFNKLLRQGVVLEQMADELGMHILLTLPIERVVARNFALAVDDGVDDPVFSQAIKASLYHELDHGAAQYFIEHFPALRPHLMDSQSLHPEVEDLMGIVGIEPWARIEISIAMEERRETKESKVIR